MAGGGDESAMPEFWHGGTSNFGLAVNSAEEDEYQFPLKADTSGWVAGILLYPLESSEVAVVVQPMTGLFDPD